MLQVGIVEDWVEETGASDPEFWFEDRRDDGPESGTSPVDEDIPF